MGFALAQAEQLAAWMAPLGASGLVVWSGTLAPDLLGTHPDNQSPAAWAALIANARQLLRRLEPVGGTLLIEPYYTHLAADVERCLRVVSEIGDPRLKLVLDPPNLIPPDRHLEQGRLIPNMISQLAPHIGLAHFKDFVVRADGQYDFPGPGQGDLDYGLYLRDLLGTSFQGWGVVEHVWEWELAPAAAYVRSRLREG